MACAPQTLSLLHRGADHRFVWSAGLVCAAFALLFPLQAGDTLLSKHKLEPGIIVWDGLADGNSADRLPNSIAALGRAGFRAIRLLLSPASRRTYALPPLRCAEGRTTLKCLFTSDGYSDHDR